MSFGATKSTSCQNGVCDSDGKKNAAFQCNVQMDWVTFLEPKPGPPWITQLAVRSRSVGSTDRYGGFCTPQILV